MHNHHHHRLKSIFPTLWGWTVHFLDGSPPSYSVSWISVGNVKRSPIFFDCFLPCLAGSPSWILPATGKFNVLWSQWVSSLLATCPYHLSLFFLNTCPIPTRPIYWRRSSFLLLSHNDALHIPLTILISAFSIRSTLDDFVAHVSLP